MTKIIKVILKDGSSIHSEFFIDGLYDSKFQRRILQELDDCDIEDYAKDYLGMSDEDEIDISDFSDGEILREANDRNLINNSENTIIADDFMRRFSKILYDANPLEIEQLLTELETKFKIV